MEKNTKIDEEMIEMTEMRERSERLKIENN
jgi:hypothetical protein